MLPANTSALDLFSSDISTLLGGAQLLNCQGSAFPMLQLLYFYVYEDLTAYGYSGPLTKAFIL